MKSNAASRVSSAASGSPRSWSSRRARQIRGIGSSGRSSASTRYCASAVVDVAAARRPRAAARATTSGFLRSMRWQRSTIGRCRLELAVFERLEAALEVGEQAILARHARFLPRFAAVRSPRYRRGREIARSPTSLAGAGAGLPGCHADAQDARRPTCPRTATRRRARGSSRPRARFLRDGRDGGEFTADRRGLPRRSDRPVGPALRRHRRGQGRASSTRPSRRCASVIDGRRGSGAHGARRAVPRHHEELRRATRRGALELLRRGEKAIENDDERTEYLAALAYATAAGDQPLAVARRCSTSCTTRVTADRARADRRARRGGRRGGGSQHARARCSTSSTTARGPRSPRSASRLVVARTTQAGDAARGRSRCARSWCRRAPRVGLPRTITEAAVGGVGEAAATPGLVGAVRAARRQGREPHRRGGGRGPRPRGGRAGRQGRRGDRDRAPRSTRRRRRDAVEQLAQAERDRDHRPDRRRVGRRRGGARREPRRAAALAATAARSKRTTGRFVFHMRHSPDARARASSRSARSPRGVKTFAVLAPESRVRQAA